eukprot:CAMPEP_0204524288 /NCGR_PEP_ID=MMETSP0661-20131031/7299_1 /ASSEMBLY_ACC=CAM_ASM_000606 /TAXON_ID=109239 /ORGANISM="Alexandrium margalefi, Strain AMGDE01CS-322" /LENGTH=81 /DNA_ID=CAMNT_0051530037 /DNA_START=23 /DNA_END=269 /DNA_ORIENTATION=+
MTAKCGNRSIGALLNEDIPLAGAVHPQLLIQVKDVKEGLGGGLLVKKDSTRVNSGPGTGSVSVMRRLPNGMPKKRLILAFT